MATSVQHLNPALSGSRSRDLSEVQPLPPTESSVAVVRSPRGAGGMNPWVWVGSSLVHVALMVPAFGSASASSVVEAPAETLIEVWEAPPEIASPPPVVEEQPEPVIGKGERTAPFEPAPFEPAPPPPIQPVQPALAPQVVDAPAEPGDFTAPEPAVALESLLSPTPVVREAAMPREAKPQFGLKHGHERARTNEEGARQLRAWISRVKGVVSARASRHYSRKARRLEQQGTVKVRVEIAPSGEFSRVLVAQSSGFSLLDNSAVEEIRAIGRVPAPPAVAGTRSQVLTVPVRYGLR
jgi:protein TonB